MRGQVSVKIRSTFLSMPDAYPNQGPARREVPLDRSVAPVAGTASVVSISIGPPSSILGRHSRSAHGQSGVRGGVTGLFA
jgi:hypothetical protein